MPEAAEAAMGFLPDDAFDAVAPVLTNAPMLSELGATLRGGNLPTSAAALSSLVEVFLKIPGEQARSIVGAILALHRMRTQTEIETGEFAAKLETWFDDQASALGKKDLVGSLAPAREAICGLLDESSPFALVNKMTELAFSHRNLLSGFRIFTDVRPVFDQRAATLVAMVITHQLALEYSDGTSEKRLDLTLDSSDIAKLRSLCNRADMKVRVIRDRLDGLDLPVGVVGAGDDK